MDERDLITDGDVEQAIGTAANKAQHSIRSDYQAAIRSPRKDSQFAEVLLACALAPKDDFGYFTAKAVQDPLSKIMGKSRKIASFVKHLNKFTEENRGSVLQRSGKSRSYIYRFENPMLQPYAVLSSLSSDLIGEELLVELQDAARGNDDPGSPLTLGI